MSIVINYTKRKNTVLFSKLENATNNFHVSNCQNYIPIYTRFFSLNSTNWNSINLNNTWSMIDFKLKNSDISEQSFNCKLKHISEEKNETIFRQAFIKSAPLLDPLKYIVGKYNYTDPNLFKLPSIENNENVQPRLYDTNNTSYIDGFFYFLSSNLLHQHNFIHGVDYYGSFLGLKHDYKLNIIDDIDYLIQSDFFINHKQELFEVEDYSHLIEQPIIKQPIKIFDENTTDEPLVGVDSIDETIFEEIFTPTTPNEPMSLDDIKSHGLDLVDITNSGLFTIKQNSTPFQTDTKQSHSTCSSRTSHTNDSENTNKTSESNCTDDLDEDEEEEEIESNWDSTESCTEETLFLTIPKFPVQVICIEKCENTLDHLLLTEDLSSDAWIAALMQIIMMLLVYQKTFSLTHNDLHTNNIMYVTTSLPYLYYTYNKHTYKVPTFGKIYKIIDFGRAIYKFKGNIFCSNSFENGGDAATQYNTEPYFNDKKPRLEPNFSFDLCRLACSMFDYVINDFEQLKTLEITEPHIKIIVDWCIDDNGINVLYKNNGAERYPDFKLYKMIARCVHNHLPETQLERDEFKQFIVNPTNIPTNQNITNINNFPSYC